MYSDRELLEMLEKMEGKYALSYDDNLLLEALRKTDVKECPICCSEVKHSVRSICAGHGEFPRYLSIKCTGCGLDYEGCVDYGNTLESVFKGFMRKAEHILKSVDSYYKRKENKHND